MLMAALRDASWYDRPNTRSVKVWHVVADAGCRSRCGLRVLADTDGNAVPAETIRRPRCRRSGCREAWPK